MEKLKGPNEPSGPELQMKAILDAQGLEYEYELPTRSGFVLDFAFPEIKTAIEVDGYYHQFTKNRDNFRDHILKRGGWLIIRIKADDLNNPELIEKHLSLVKSRLKKVVH